MTGNSEKFKLAIYLNYFNVYRCIQLIKKLKSIANLYYVFVVFKSFTTIQYGKRTNELISRNQHYFYYFILH